MTTRTSSTLRRMPVFAFLVCILLCVSLALSACGGSGSSKSSPNYNSGAGYYSGGSSSTYNSSSDPGMQDVQNSQACSYAYDWEAECNASSGDGVSSQYWNGYGSDNSGDTGGDSGGDSAP